MWLLKNWLYVAAFALGLFIAASVSSLYWQNKLRLAGVSCNEQKALLLAKQAEAEQKTEEINREHANKIADLNQRIADAKRVHKNRCVTVHQSSAASGGVSSSRPGHVGNNAAVDSNDLIDYAGECEQIRIDWLAMVEWAKKLK